MDWSIGGIHTREDAIRNKMADILLNTAYCLCLNAEKRDDRVILYQGGTMTIRNSRFVDGSDWNLVPDQEVSYRSVNVPYQNESYAKELSKHRWLYSVFNRSVRNTGTALMVISDSISSRNNYFLNDLPWRYSPFEYCPSHLLEQFCEVYQTLLIDFEPLIPQKFDMRLGASIPYRQAQDEYLGKVTTLLTNGYTQVSKICDAYKAAQTEESNRIYATSTREGRTKFVDPYYAAPYFEQQNKYPEYADGFRMIELKRNIMAVETLYYLLIYSLRPTGPYICTVVQTYSGQAPSPYSNWCSIIAELHVEAIQCHLNMMLQLIPLRKELEIMNVPNVPVYTHANVPLNSPVNVPLNEPVYTHANVKPIVLLNRPNSPVRGPKGSLFKKPRIPVRHTKKSQPRPRKVPGNAVGFGRTYTRKTTENKPFQNNALEKLRKKYSRHTKKN